MSKDFTRTQKNKIKAYAQCMLDLAKENIRNNHNFVSKSWNPRMNVDFRSNHSYCDGRNFISISINNYKLEDGTYESLEYPHIANKKIIGSFKTNDWRVLVKSLISHELGHSLQFEMYKSIGRLKAPKVTKGNYDGLHGKDWQNYYKWITLNGFKEGYWEKMEGHL